MIMSSMMLLAFAIATAHLFPINSGVPRLEQSSGINSMHNSFRSARSFHWFGGRWSQPDDERFTPSQRLVVEAGIPSVLQDSFFNRLALDCSVCVCRPAVVTALQLVPVRSDSLQDCGVE